MGIENALVLKTDNGFNATILSATSPSVFEKGFDLFNRNFHPWPKGEVLLVQLNISKTGRRVVKKVTSGKGIPSFTHFNASAGSKLKAAELDRMDEAAKVVREVGKQKETERMVASKIKDALNGYYISPEARVNFSTAKAMSDARPERAVKLMMVGPTGYGKTTLPKVFADVIGYDYLRINCASIRDPEEWFGYREARGGDTVFIRSQFAKAIEKGKLVVVLDEFNRLEPWLHNTLFPLLDHDGCTVVHDEEFRIGPNVIVVGTINLGYQFTGTHELDEALLNRFEFFLEVGPLPHLEEVKVLRTRTKVDEEEANVIVKTCNTLRQNSVSCSTRTSILIANMVKTGLSVREAFETAVIRRIPSDETGNNLRKSVVDLVNVAVGVLEDRELSQDVFSLPGEVFVRELSHNIQLRASGEGSILGMVPLIVALRRLPLKDGNLSLRDAQKVAEEIQAGKTVNLALNKKPDAFADLVENFRACGVSGRYTAN
jgi:MoxR-like ATPase